MSRTNYERIRQEHEQMHCDDRKLMLLADVSEMLARICDYLERMDERAKKQEWGSHDQ